MKRFFFLASLAVSVAVFGQKNSPEIAVSVYFVEDSGRGGSQGHGIHTHGRGPHDG